MIWILCELWKQTCTKKTRFLLVWLGFCGNSEIYCEKTRFLLIIVNKERRNDDGYLAYITKRQVYGGGVMQSESLMFACKLVCMMDGAITAMAKCSFICRTEHRGLHFVTDITLDLHISFFFLRALLLGAFLVASLLYFSVNIMWLFLDVNVGFWSLGERDKRMMGDLALGSRRISY